MEIKFLFNIEMSFLGTEESAICGIKIDGAEVPFTGACAEVFHFGITADEVAAFAANANSVHFEREIVCLPVRGTGLNDKQLMEEVAVLTVRAVRAGEVVRTAQISRVVSRW